MVQRVVRRSRQSAMLARAVVEALESRCLLTVSFPGAEGFGALATGGRGGSVYHVTNLNDSGAGSLRDAVSAGNRTVVFDVGGVINLSSQLVFASNLTIAGQTAPGGGITVNGQGMSFSGQTNVIVRYMRFRSSHLTSDGTKAVNITTGTNMIFDHVSISWGRWDNLGFTNNSDSITIQNSIVSEAIDPQRLGALIDSSRNISVLRNLWIDNQSRNPKGKADMQYINNVVYNWGSSGYDGGHSAAVWNQDLINNYFIKGPSSNDSFLAQFTPTDYVFNSGNLVDLNKDGALNGRAVVAADFLPNTSTSGTATFVSAAYNVPSVAATVKTATEAYSLVLAGAGASLHRDSVDVRILNQLQSLGTLGAIITDETLVGGAGTVNGGTAPTDTDGDGMPDAWEVANGLNPNLADNNGDKNGDGYTNLENYINSLLDTGGSNAAPTVATAAQSSPATVTGKTASLSVLGADDGGEAALAYTWVASGPASVSFSSNGANASKNTTATFSRSGTYTLTATIQDAFGLSTTSAVTVVVAQVLTSSAVSPGAAAMVPGGTKQFTAATLDQFGQAMAAQPVFTWSVVSGGGTISASGLYTAPGVTGNATVQAVGGGMTATASVTVMSLVPKGWWKLNESAGTVVSDASGNSYNGTAINGPVWTTGVMGNGLSFDGVDDYVDLPASLVSTAAGSVSLWVKTNTVFTDAAHLFYAATSAVGNGGGSESELHVNFTASNQLQFFIEGGTTDVSIVSPLTYNDNAWHNVVATWDINGNAVLYVDGSAVGTVVHDALSFTGTAVTRLGRPGTGVRYYKGLMDDVRLYSTVISAAQVQALYAEGSNQAPTVATGAAATPSVIAVNHTALSVLGADDGGEAGLSYTWSMVAGPAGAVTPAFSANGTNGAKNTTVTFMTPGSYTMRATIRDGAGLSVTSDAAVTFSPVTGDANFDGNVDLADYDVWYRNVGAANPAGAAEGDLNNDGKVDLGDYDVWYRHVGQGAAVVAGTTVVTNSATAASTSGEVASPTSVVVMAGVVTNAEGLEAKSPLPEADVRFELVRMEEAGLPHVAKARLVGWVPSSVPNAGLKVHARRREGFEDDLMEWTLPL